MEIHASHDIPCSQANFWSLYWDPVFSESLRTHAKIHTELIWEKDTEAQYQRRVMVSPERTLPAPLAKILGSSRLTYAQESCWEKAEHLVHWEITPTVLPNKLTAKGVFEIKSSTPSSCQMVVRGDVRVKIPFVGGRIERLIVDEVVESYATIADRIHTQLHNSSS
jgi:hypothetical protein